MEFPAPYRDGDGRYAEMTDQEQGALLHIRVTLSCVRQLLRYTIQTRAPPWVFSKLLHEQLGSFDAEGLEYMKRLSKFLDNLLGSHDPR